MFSGGCGSGCGCWGCGSPGSGGCGGVGPATRAGGGRSGDGVGAVTVSAAAGACAPRGWCGGKRAGAPACAWGGRRGCGRHCPATVRVKNIKRRKKKTHLVVEPGGRGGGRECAREA